MGDAWIDPMASPMGAFIEQYIRAAARLNSGESAASPAAAVPPTAPAPAKDATQLPQAATGRESVSYNAGQNTPIAKSTKAPSLGQELYVGPDSIAAQAREATPAAVPQMPQAQAAPGGMETLQRFMMQAGLSLMTGGWGNPISQIGQAAGEGVEAIGREEKLRQGQDQQKLDAYFKSAQLDTQQQQADAGSVNAAANLESSRSRRLGKTSLEEQATAGMSPEAQAYFRTRLKSLNKSVEGDPLSDEPAPDPQAAYDQLLTETRAVDMRTRAATGRLRADEVSDRAIAAVVADPTKEQILLNQVKADPVQVGILRKKLEAARGVGNAGR